MNALRRARTLIAILGVVVLTTAPAAAVITASDVNAGGSSQTMIEVITSDTPAFSAAPPAGLTVSFATPTEVGDNDWRTTMTLSPAADMAPGAYSFPLTVSGATGVLFSDTVAVQVLPSLGTTTSAPGTTTTAAPAPSASTSTTAPPATTALPATTAPPAATTTVPPATTTTTTTTTLPPTTTSAPTTTTTTTSTTTATIAAPSTTEVAPATSEDAAAGPPGAVIDPNNALPLAVVLPLGGLGLFALGGIVIGVARRRRFTPASKGMFYE